MTFFQVWNFKLKTFIVVLKTHAFFRWFLQYNLEILIYLHYFRFAIVLYYSAPSGPLNPGLLHVRGITVRPKFPSSDHLVWLNIESMLLNHTCAQASFFTQGKEDPCIATAPAVAEARDDYIDTILVWNIYVACLMMVLLNFKLLSNQTPAKYYFEEK